MNKVDLIHTVTEKTGFTKKDVSYIIEETLNGIADALAKGERVQLVGFGNFEMRERAARKGRNPQTGEPIEIAASRIPTFRPGKTLRDGVQ